MAATSARHRSTGRLGTKTRFLFVILAALVVTSGFGSIAGAQEEPETGLRGTLREQTDDGAQPVEGVRIVAETADGEPVGEAVSDAEGAWLIPVPEPGDYVVTIDQATLPEGIGLPEDDSGVRELTVNPRQIRPVLFQLGVDLGGGGDGGGQLRLVLQLTVEGIKFGLLIAMMAIGLSLIFGTTGLVNFAHGEVVTFGAIVAWWFNVTLGMQFFLAAALAIAVSAAAGALLDLGVFRPLRKRGVGLIAQLVVTIGLSLALRYLLLYFFRGDPRSYADYAIQRGVEIGPILLTPKDMWSILISILVLAGVGLLLQRTKIGKAMRAVADNRDLAESSGIDVQRVILFVWAAGSGLAALGGIMWGLGESVSWIMGFRLLLLIFAGVILGGLGTAYGALVGSLVVGIFIQLSTIVIPSELKNVGALAVLVVILVFRPQGILGRAERIG